MLTRCLSVRFLLPLLLALSNAQAQDHRTNNMDSAFGIFTAHAPGTASWFRQEMGWSMTDYAAFVTQHFARLNAHWDRSTISWDAIEPTLGGGYNWNNYTRIDDTVTGIYNDPSRSHWLGTFNQGGGNNRIPMDYTNEYATFLRTIVQRYNGDGTNDASTNVFVKWWQPANETQYWQGTNGWDEDYYVTFASFVSRIVKQTDPEAKIVLMATVNGVTMESFITNVIHQMAPDRLFDAMDIHYWNDADDWKMTAIAPYRNLLDSLSLTNVQIWSGEHGTWVGQPGSGGYQSEEDQANSLIKRAVWNLANGLDKIFWNELVDFHSFEGKTNSMWNSVGLISDGDQSGDDPSRLNTERISYWAYALLASRIDNGHGTLLGTVGSIHNDSSLYAYRYTTDATGDEFFILWRENGTQNVSLSVTGTVYTVRNMITDRFGAYQEAYTVTASLSSVSLALTDEPLFVEAGINTNYILGSNTLPLVAITAPSNNYARTTPSTFSITASASDPDGTITQVAFFANGSPINGPDKTSPYSTTWTNVSAGTYALTAVARDNRNGQTTSTAVNVTISSPDFSITSIRLSPPTPAAGSTFTAYITITNDESVLGTGGYLYVYNHQPTNVGTGTTGNKSATVGAVGAYSSKVVTITGLSSGSNSSRIFRAFVDARGTTTETTETNNQATLAYNIMTLTNLLIAGPTAVGEATSTAYTCTALYSGTNQDVTADVTWSENSSYATISSNGLLRTTNTLTADASVTITTTLSGKSDTHVVTMLNDLRPDFSIDSISLSPGGTIPAGKTFTAYVTVRNQGVVSGSGAYVDLWTNSPVTVTGKTHGTKYGSMGTLTNGTTRLYTFTSITAPKTNGVFTFRAFADALQTVAEVSETNNQSTLSYTVRLLTNLVVTGPTLVGESSTNPYTATAYFSDGFTENVTAWSTWSENSSYATITASGELRSTNTLTTNYGATVTATYGGKSATLAITLQNDLRPDFAIAAITLVPGGTLPAGKTFNAIITVTNQGVVPGNAGYLDIWTNRPGTVTGKTHGTKYSSLGTITNGRGKTVTFSNVTVPFSNNVYTFRAYADALQATAESNDTNNQATVAITCKLVTNLVVNGLTTLGEATSTAYTCTALFSDGSSEDVSPWVTWSENSSYSLISSNGTLTSTNVLTADSSVTITATFASRTGTRSVTLQNSLRPDFVISALSMSPTSPVLTRASLTAYVTVQNVGLVSGSGGYVDVWTNSPGTVTGKTHGTKYSSVGTLGIGSNKTFTFSGMTAPASNGAYVFRAFADSQQITTESNETNNQATLNYTTRTITNLTLTGAAAVFEQSGDQFTATAYYSDGNNSNVTFSSTWSDNSSYAVINNTGWLSTLAISANQSCKITVTYGGISTNKTVIILNN